VVVVALKVAVVAAAATVTDAGTVSVELASIRVTIAPPAGAGPLRVTVQVEALKALRAAGRQDREVTAGKAATTETVPPVEKSTMPFPAGEDALPLIPIGAVFRAAAIVRFTTAATPFEMIPAFIAQATQVYVPGTP
jgi:hypothetical protein